MLCFGVDNTHKLRRHFSKDLNFKYHTKCFFFQFLLIFYFIFTNQELIASTLINDYKINCINL